MYFKVQFSVDQTTYSQISEERYCTGEAIFRDCLSVYESIQ